MAHMAKLSALTDALMTELSHSPTQKRNPSQRKDASIRILRSQNYPRTNHFEVEDKLLGLEEKFRIVNKDDLANALYDRVEELKQRSDKWTPEILHLLLELADQPAVKSRLEKLNHPRPLEVQDQEPLRWEDLAKEDPELRDKSIWENVDFAEDSSDESEASERDESSFICSSIESLVEADELPRLDAFIVPSDSDGLKAVKATRSGKQTPIEKFKLFPEQTTNITELQSIRETLFMLRGLPTSLFKLSQTSIEVQPGFRMKHLSPEAFHSSLTRFANLGSSLLYLKTWTTQRSDRVNKVVLLESLQDRVAAKLQETDAIISQIQDDFVAPRSDITVSLIDIASEIEDQFRRVECLTKVVQAVEDHAIPFRCLEVLYEMTCAIQMAGENDVFKYIGTLFFECLNVYLRPVQDWMEHGRLTGAKESFFVMETDSHLDLVSIWKDRFKMRRTTDGIPYGPNFLHDLCQVIFITGKSVVLLKQLGFDHRDARIPSIADESILSWDALCSGDEINLISFAELFETAMSEWVHNRRRSISTVVRGALFEQCGLSSSLSALERVYFMSDGATASQLCAPIFEKLDTGRASWNDRYTLTDLVQSTIGALNDVSAEALRTGSITLRRYNTIIQARKTVQSLAMLTIQYRLPWPVQIIIGQEAMTTYQALFVALLQIRRSRHMLDVRLLNDPANIDSSVDERSLYYGLRSRLIWFTTTLYTYMTEAVIQANTINMKLGLSEAEDVDHMIRVHEEYIKRLREQALLGSRLQPIRRAILSILDLSIKLWEARAQHVKTQTKFSTSTASMRGHRQSRYGTQPGDGIMSDSETDEEPSMLDEQDEEDSMVADELDYIGKLRKGRADFDRLLRFVYDGLKGVARSGGEAAHSWGMLAEMLDAGQPEEKY